MGPDETPLPMPQMRAEPSLRDLLSGQKALATPTGPYADRPGMVAAPGGGPLGLGGEGPGLWERFKTKADRTMPLPVLIAQGVPSGELDPQTSQPKTKQQLAEERNDELLRWGRDVPRVAPGEVYPVRPERVEQAVAEEADYRRRNAGMRSPEQPLEHAVDLAGEIAGAMRDPTALIAGMAVPVTQAGRYVANKVAKFLLINGGYAGATAAAEQLKEEGAITRPLDVIARAIGGAALALGFDGAVRLGGKAIKIARGGKDAASEQAVRDAVRTAAADAGLSPDAAESALLKVVDTPEGKLVLPDARAPGRLSKLDPETRGPDTAPSSSATTSFLRTNPRASAAASNPSWYFSFAAARHAFSSASFPFFGRLPAAFSDSRRICARWCRSMAAAGLGEGNRPACRSRRRVWRR
jgi:hypothetical protein